VPPEPFDAHLASSVIVPPPALQYCLNLSAPFICEVPPFKKTLTDLMPYVDYLFGNGEFNKSEDGVYAGPQSCVLCNPVVVASVGAMCPFVCLASVQF
jgi:hypothetical protein